MRKTILLYGVAMAVLIGILKAIEYRFLIRDISTELAIGLVAVLFGALGVWAGRKLTRTRVVVSHPYFTLDESELRRLGISKREYEVLELMSAGLSNQEIADKLFVSVSTVKTHSSNLFIKLDARRRTQAVQRAKELRLLP
jgi:DNA-binding CsgD family transcriptional regulator